MGLKNILLGLGNKPAKESRLNELLGEWINKIENYSKPHSEIKALSFGLFESDKGFTIYLTGAKVYNSENDDWATEIDYEPLAQYKYLLLSSGDVRGVRWEELLEKVKAELEIIINTNPKYTLFKNRIVAIGFDDGDLYTIKAS
jgi:hypothetical protein